MRSLPVVPSKSLSVKARVILQHYNNDQLTKNCYILFKEEKSSTKALAHNSKILWGQTIRVDSTVEKELDFTKTIFVGNLPYTIKEEEIRKHFKACGVIKNVRVIRDKETHEGKGFGYIYFESPEGYQKGLDMNRTILANREIRVKKAVAFERLEKKKLKKDQKQNIFNALKRVQKKTHKNFNPNDEN